MKPLTIQLNRFPDGKKRALTFSYDDGRDFDRRLVEIFDAHGLKGTFHLNSANIGKEGFISAEDVQRFAQRHEVSAHSVTHPHLPHLSPEQLIWEMWEDRRALENWAGSPVRGMSYPYGTHSPEVIAILPSLGIQYSRTVESHGRFDLPTNWLLWHPTCHHKTDIAEKWPEFLNARLGARPLLFYVWGHSYEFEHNQNWDLIERFAELAATGADQVWFATNIEIYDYQLAVSRLEFSVDHRFVHNPSALSVWIGVNGKTVEVPGGARVNLAT